MRVVLACARSSPGVTTAMLACASVWPGRVLLVEAAEVVGIEPVGTQGQRFISLQAGEADASAVAQAAATGEVRLILIARDTGEVDG